MIKLSNKLINSGEFSMSEQASGSCLCGRLSYSFDRDHVISAHHCHCTDCRKMTGSGKATIIMVPTLIVYITFQKQIQDGITTGALKG